VPPTTTRRWAIPTGVAKPPDAGGNRADVPGIEDHLAHLAVGGLGVGKRPPAGERDEDLRGRVGVEMGAVPRLGLDDREVKVLGRDRRLDRAILADVLADDAPDATGAAGKRGVTKSAGFGSVSPNRQTRPSSGSRWITASPSRTRRRPGSPPR
jgi:hypothetical protein